MNLNTPEMREKARKNRAAKVAERKAAGIPSLRKSVDAKCKDCAYDEEDRGTWRQQVTACTATECPLWPHRPLSKPTKV